MADNEQLPGKHRLTGHRIFKLVWAEGYRGSESSVLMYLWKLRKAKRQVKVFIPLEFEPGQDGQVRHVPVQAQADDEQVPGVPVAGVFRGKIQPRAIGEPLQ